MTPELKKAIEIAAKAEKIYEPKYGGKDHSGYDTMMLYEINDEREECFEKGAYFGYNLAAEQLEEARKDNWVRVEDAPKDGSNILGYDPNTEEIYIVWWNMHMGNGCWNYSSNQYIPKITHWQPLPKPPLTTKP